MTSQATVISPARRRFLGQSGLLTLAAFAGNVIDAYVGIAQAQSIDARRVTAWVSISADGTTTIKFGSGEMGQGVMTSLPLIVAEEMDADWSMVRAEPATHDPGTYGNPRTGGILYAAGSSSVQGYFDILRRTGATARRILVHTVARHWDVPPAQLQVRSGVVSHPASNRQLRFGEIVALPDLVTNVPAVTDTDLKPRSAYRLLGTDIPRLDVPDKVRGAAIYTVDVRVPDMVYASLLYSPVEGETPEAVVDGAARSVKGVRDVIRLDNAVAVIADRWFTARKGRDQLQVTWSRKSSFQEADSARDLADQIAAVRNPAVKAVIWSDRGNVEEALGTARNVVEAEYSTEYTYHAQMEPLAAVASVDPDGKGAEIWFATQSQTVSIGVAAEVLGTTPDKIRMHQLYMGGGFGRRTFFAREVLKEALILSRTLKRPVKIIWTREDDVKCGWFRPATAHKIRAGLGPNGTVQSWHHRLAAGSIFGYVAPQRLAAAGGKDLLIMEGTELTPYDIPHFRAEHIASPRRARLSAWRGIGWGHDHFATESFVDELALAARKDPVAFRRELLRKDPRALAVLNAVVAMSGFGKPPRGRAHGIAMSGYKDALAAGVAEVSVDRTNGAIRVHRFWTAVDCGLCLQPLNTRAQIDGGIIWAVSAALKERISIQNGQVQQSNFHDYPFIRRSETPEIDIKIMESDLPPQGVGEIGVPMTASAMANAVYSLTKVRLRHLPFDSGQLTTAKRT